MLQHELLAKIRELFFYFGLDKFNEVKEHQKRFAYYTSAETAVQILRTGRIWMRDTRVMNDAEEFSYGMHCLKTAYDKNQERFERLLNTCFEGLAEEVKMRFNAWAPGLMRDTYIACVSVHDEDEDEHGRLSMWRAYGGTAGVALVLKHETLLNNNFEDIGVYASPVAYSNLENFVHDFEDMLDKLEGNFEFLRTMGKNGLKHSVFQMFRFLAICTKHPGFHEEQEWRLITTPSLRKSPLTEDDLAVVRGIPQRILKIRLDDQALPQRDFRIKTVLDRLIIGPCDFPDVVYPAMFDLLKIAGIADPEEKIEKSGIPLRQF